MTVTISNLGASLGGQAHFFLNYLLARHGLAPSDVTAIATKSQPAAIAALERVGRRNT